MKIDGTLFKQTPSILLSVFSKRGWQNKKVNKGGMTYERYDLLEVR